MGGRCVGEPRIYYWRFWRGRAAWQGGEEGLFLAGTLPAGPVWGLAEGGFQLPWRFIRDKYKDFAPATHTL